MNDLEKCRVEIDEIDRKIIELFEKRMEVVKKVTKYKKDNNLPILDSSREAKMKEKNIQLLKNREFAKYYETVLDGYLKASKDMQKDLITEG